MGVQNTRCVPTVTSHYLADLLLVCPRAQDTDRQAFMDHGELSDMAQGRRRRYSPGVWYLTARF
jgi:hypothetical protein